MFSGMTAGFLLTLAVAVAWALVGIVYSRAAATRIEMTPFLFAGGTAFLLLTWLLCCPPFAVDWREVGIVAAVLLPAALLGQGGFLTMARAMKQGSHGIAWCFSQAALIMPFLTGWLLLDNPVAARQWTGLAVLTAALAMLGAAGNRLAEEGRRRFPWWALAAFLLLGCQQSLTLIPNGLQLSGAALAWRLPLSSLGGVIWILPVWKRKLPLTRQLWAWGVLYGAVVMAGQFLLYWALDVLSPHGMEAIVYPVAVGGSIGFFTLYCRLVRRERLAWLAWGGILLCLAGIVLLRLP